MECRCFSKQCNFFFFFLGYTKLTATTNQVKQIVVFLGAFCVVGKAWVLAIGQTLV